MNNTIPTETKTKEVPLIDKVTATYSNLFKVEHSQEEFHFTFMIVSGEMAEVTAKVIVTPGHMKRLIETMQENVKMYEKNFGEVASVPRDHPLVKIEEPLEMNPLNVNVIPEDDEGKEE